MNKTLKVIIEILLLFVIGGLVYLIVDSIMQPVSFNKEKAAREQVGIQRLKDLRTLQVAYKGVTGRFTYSVDSLIDFYNKGKMEVIMQIGSQDDSLAVANTARIKKQNRKITTDELMALYRKGESLVFSTKTEIPVKDTLFNNRPDFCADSLAYIPFSGGGKIEIESIVKTVSGVPVPLFEARMPYKALLKGLDDQLRINLDADRRAQNRYEGLQVGSVTAPNNNAGNWE